MTEREAADRLNLMPNYVGILERDDYTSLRSPPFARGYVKAYGRMLGLHEETLMSVFDQTTVIAPIKNEKRKDTRPLQLQRTGLGVVIGLGVLLLLVVLLWWSRAIVPSCLCLSRIGMPRCFIATHCSSKLEVINEN